MADAHLIPSETINDFLEPLQVTILLGADIPALAGTYTFSLTILNPRLVPGGELLGCFQTQNDAERYLANYFLNIKEHEVGPWAECKDSSPHLPIRRDQPNNSQRHLLAIKKEYLLDHDYKDILKWIRDNYRQPNVPHYKIEKFTILEATPLVLDESF